MPLLKSVLVLVILGPALAAGPALAERIFVDQAVVAGNGSGSDWLNAFDELDDALNAAFPGDEVWVAEGTYIPRLQVPTFQGDPTDPRNATFRLVDGVAIFGGFSGGETSLGQRNPDPATNGCVLDGFDGASNVYHVVTAENVNDGTLLDGFTVTHGVADGDTALTSRGAGIVHVGGTLTLRNLLVKGNRTAPGNEGQGAGLFSSSGDVTVEHTVFQDNTAGQGGAIFTQAELSLLDTALWNNSTTFSGGGGLFAQSAEVSITDSLFVENFGNNEGGGLLARDNTRVRLERVTFAGNVTRFGGAGVFAQADAFIVAVNSAFVGNTARQGDGGAISLRESIAILTNCTVAANVAGLTGGGIAVLDGVEIGVQNSVLFGNLGFLGGQTSAQQLYFHPGSSVAAAVNHSVVEGGFAGPNLSDDPLFIRTPSPGDGDWETPADNDYGDLRLRPGSPAIDAGDNTADLDAGRPGIETIVDVATDLDGGPRLIDDPATADTGIGSAPIVDIGAYEHSLFADGFESGDTSRWSATVDRSRVLPWSNDKEYKR